jgi:hypothetical protein
MSFDRDVRRAVAVCDDQVGLANRVVCHDQAVLDGRVVRALFAGQKINGADRNRTGDLRRAKPALSQLSYSPSSIRDQLQASAEGGMVGLSGVEPLTSRLSGVRSSQLSYRPNAAWFSVVRVRPYVSPIQPSEQK